LLVGVEGAPAEELIRGDAFLGAEFLAGETLGFVWEFVSSQSR